MRFLSVGLCLLGALASFASAGPSDAITGANAAQHFALINSWKSFKTQFSKSYETPEAENQRFAIFSKNMARVKQLNANEAAGGAEFGVTRFMDLDEQEFQQKYLGFLPKKGMAAKERLQMPVEKPTVKVNADTDVDWRKKGAVTAVKDQGSCGSCWAFSAVEEVESMWFMKHGQLPTLSEQQVVSCDTKGQDQGCNGGDTVTAFDYIKKVGLEAEKTYPYTASDSTCKFNAANVVANITGYTYATPACFDSCAKQDESTLLSNLASLGPVSICVYASSWQFYTGGVMTSSCPSAYNTLNHCVQLVGYQSASPNNYWLVRNSWGTSWGEQGYIYLKYGSNLCGLADEATFATSA